MREVHLKHPETIWTCAEIEWIILRIHDFIQIYPEQHGAQRAKSELLTMKYKVWHGLGVKHCYSIPWMRSKWMRPKIVDLLLIWGPVLWWLSGSILGIPCAHIAEVSDIPFQKKPMTGWSKQVNIYMSWLRSEIDENSRIHLMEVPIPYIRPIF